MAVELADAYISIVPSGRGLQQNIASQLSGAGFNQQGQQAGNQAADGFGSKFGPGIAKVAALAGGALAAIGVGSFVVDAVGAASDLNETLSKSAAIFGDQAGAIERWGDTAAKTLGLSKAAALASAAGFGDMFTQLGFTGDAAASMSKDVVQTAADLGSFNNLETGDVLDRLSGAFRGEYDSLQAVIPNISAARVETEALAASGKTNASELTAQEKAAAVLAIVHADGAKAAGDFAKTSNGLANEQKILSASFEDVKAKIGTALLPILTKLGTFAIDKLLPGLSKLADTVVSFLGPAFAGLTAGFTENDVTSTGLFGTFERLGVQVRAIATWVMTTLVPALQQLWSWVQEHIIPAVTTLVSSVMSGLASAFDTIKTKIEENKPQLMELWQWFVTIAEFITDKVVPVYATYLKGALEVVGVAIGVLIDIISGFVDSANWMAGAVSAAVDWVKNAWSTATSWIGQRVDEIVGFFTALPGRITGAATGMWDGLTSSFKSAINKIIGWWNNLSLGFDGFSVSIPLAPDISVPGFSIGTPNIPFLWQGGTATRGGLSVVGDRGPELLNMPRGASVIPLNRAGELGDGSNGMVRILLEGTGVLANLRKEIRVQGGNVQAVLGA